MVIFLSISEVVDLVGDCLQEKKFLDMALCAKNGGIPAELCGSGEAGDGCR